MESTTTAADPSPRRPLSVAVVAVLMVIYGLASLLPKILLLTSREVRDTASDLTAAMTAGGLLSLPLGLQIAMGFVASFVLILAGVFVWRGRDWARWLVAFWMAFSLLLYVLQTGLTWLVAIKLPVFVLVLFLLFRPQATDHFR